MTDLHILPVPIDDVSLVFPADALEYMPAWDDIPDEHKYGRGSARKWRAMADMWFFKGIASDYTGYLPVMLDSGERIDGEMIDRQINAILGSYAPKHEHKMAAVSYLLSLWLDSAIYGPEGCSIEDVEVIGESIDLDEWRKYVEEVEETDA